MLWLILHFVVASTAEAKLGALFLNCQEEMNFRLTLQDLGHPQPKTSGAQLTINNIASANIDLNNYINILSKHTAKLTKEQLKAYSSWFFGTEDKALAPRATTADMVACMANLDAPGNQGLVATCKIQLCRKSAMLYHFLVNLLKTTKMICFRMEQDKHTYV